MVIVEYRIPLPLTTEEFHRGQLYMVAQQSLEATSDDEGVEWLKNEPYDNTDGHMGISEITGTPVPKNKGQYTLKRYLLKSKVPSIVAALVPSNALFLIEEAWNAYPHCKTVLVNGYMSKDKFKIDVETMHVDSNINLENAVGLSAEELAARKVDYVDIRDGHCDATPKKDYIARYDCCKVSPEKTCGRGPLPKGWEQAGTTAARPVMCCYKVIRAKFAYFGVQTKVENIITGSQKDLFARTLSAAFCTLDEWSGKTMADVRALEKDVADRAADKLKKVSAESMPMPVTSSSGGGAGGSA